MQRHLFLFPMVLCACLVWAKAPAAMFSLTECFGVSHPEQIVLFDYTGKADPRALALRDAAGISVPFQVLRDGRLAVRADLPAGSARSWTLDAGTPAPAQGGVTVREAAQYYEITNELIGIRVPKASADPARTPAPIQGLRYRDGGWTATGPNWMSRPAKAMQVDVLENGPLIARVRVSYRYDTGPLRSSVHHELPVIPAGEGDYSTTIEVQAGQPAIRFEEECETDVFYRVDISNGLDPDHAQYRGHHATSVEDGMEPDGKVYLYGNNTRHDALVLLNYSSKERDRWSPTTTTYPLLSHWNPWAVNTGFYWQLYHAAPGGSDNLFGIFAGPASRLINPGLSGVSFDTRLVEGKPIASLQVRFQRMMPTQYYSTHMRFDWGIFLGKQSVDLHPPMEVQGINRQMNLFNSMNLTKLARFPVEYPDPARGYGNLYAPASAWKAVAEALRAERAKGGRTFYAQQYSANSHLQEMLDFWAAPSPAAAEKAAMAITDFARAYLNTRVNGEGIYQHTTHYFMGASSMSSYLTWIDVLLASGQLSPETKTRVKQAAALFGGTLWDDDAAPMQTNSGMNLGPANMSSMWCGTRYSYALLLANHPAFRERAADVGKEALNLLHNYTDEDGACDASAHYTSATMVPILNLLQQLQMSGVLDAFATDPRLEKYAEWEMQLLTPPEVRFGGQRKIIAVGDGSYEQCVRIGQLGTGLAPSHPVLSARLMGAWKAMGSPQDNFYGPSLFKIAPALPATSPALGDATFPGWLSVLRAGWDTKDESAVYFIHGDTLSDHRHNDMGEVLLYALGAPLSLDFGSMYYPRPDGGMLHSLALPESALGRAWDADNIPLSSPPGPGGRASWWYTQAQPLLSFRDSASGAARFAWYETSKDMHWQRTVRFFHPDPAHPVILIDDDFSGKDLAGKPVVSTLNMMAQGPVTTPAGPIIPVERTHQANQNTTSEQLPSAGTPFALAPGLNKFTFTGQWLIDWDLYTDAVAPMQAAIGHWCEKWHPSTEQNQFKQTQGRPFEERQHLLRVRGQDHMRFVILPYRKGERPDPCTVERQGAMTLIHLGDIELTIKDHGCTMTRGLRLSLTAFDDVPVAARGVRLQGGPAEIVLEEKTGTLTLSGPAGPRRLTLPKPWRLAASPAAVQQGEEWIVQYAGGKPVTLAIE